MRPISQSTTKRSVRHQAAPTGKPASALDRGTAGLRPVAVMPLCCDRQRQYNSD